MSVNARVESRPVPLAFGVYVLVRLARPAILRAMALTKIAMAQTGPKANHVQMIVEEREKVKPVLMETITTVMA
jgi:hypothetical protein